MSKQETKSALDLWNDSEQKGIRNIVQMFPPKNVSKEHITENDLLKEIDENWRWYMPDIPKNDSIEHEHNKLNTIQEEK